MSGKDARWTAIELADAKLRAKDRMARMVPKVENTKENGTSPPSGKGEPPKETKDWTP